MITKYKDNEFKIKFDGQPYQVDAQTFINSLINMSTVIEEINYELNSDKRIEVKIKAVEKGSFIAGISLEEVNNIKNLFTSENIHLAADIVTIMVGVYTIKKFLNGKKPKNTEEQGDLIKIENEKGIIQVFDNRTYGIYNKNQIIHDAISNNFATLEDDPSVTAFEIMDKENKPIFSATREEFDRLAVKSEIQDEDKRVQTVVATVTIHKIVFEDRYKWEFYYLGNKISASIIDENFFDKINKGESFSKGDSLKVDLQINQIFDSTVNIYINSSYQINKVHEHIPRGESKQLKID